MHTSPVTTTQLILYYSPKGLNNPLRFLIGLGALSDFDGDFLPDLGTQHPPANYCARNSSLSPIALKIGSKDAGPFEPMYV